MIECITTGQLDTNSYIISNEKKECVLIDPGLGYKDAAKYIKENYIPKAIQEELFREQSVRAYYNFPLSDKYVSLMIFAGSYMDEDRVTNSVFYLVNYDFEGNIIDYIRVASYICEGGYSCCTINQHNIWYISYEECPVKFKYAVHEVIPMIESRLKYDIGTDGHFSKKEVLFYRKGFYKATADGDFFRFYKSFPEE